MAFGCGGTPAAWAVTRDGSRWLSGARSAGTACRGGRGDVAVAAALHTGESEQTQQACKTPQACVVAVAVVCIGGDRRRGG